MYVSYEEEDTCNLLYKFTIELPFEHGAQGS